MVVAALFYAFYAVFVKYSGFEGIGSWEILFFRSIFGVVLFLRRYAFQRHYAFHHSSRHLIRSMCGTLSIICGIYSVSHLNIGLAMTLNYTSPLFVGAYILTTSLLHHARELGTDGDGAFRFYRRRDHARTNHRTARILCRCSGFSRGLFSLQMPQRLLRNSACFMSRNTNYFLPCSGRCDLRPHRNILTGGFHPWSVKGALYILGLCICATGGQFCLTRAFSRGNLVLSSSLQYTVILFSTILGEILFLEPATFPVICGMLIIVFSD